ncbi:hypothetical protein BpHYR1_031132 [Brachionus plicatilis]|uniref:Uncharacterized protein n=1 Tax=Brachionus plicatilis TaxID=10195 RepID=A0A3M7SIZ1_BRAPC|nr:hypothetical protein BpHYR1_031132 [Brachionus plicatilis]
MLLKLQWIYQENEEDQRNQQLREKNKKKLISSQYINLSVVQLKQIKLVTTFKSRQDEEAFDDDIIFFYQL